MSSHLHALLLGTSETMVKANQGNEVWLYTAMLLSYLCVVAHIPRLMPSPSLEIHDIAAVHVKLQWILGQFGVNFA
jgi:hypothetical protein